MSCLAFCIVRHNDNMSNVDQFRALVATCTTDELAVALSDPATAVKVKAALAKADAAPQNPLQDSPPKSIAISSVWRLPCPPRR